MKKKNTLINELSFKNMSLNNDNHNKDKDIASLKRNIDMLNNRNATLNEENIKIHMDHEKIRESNFELVARLNNDLEEANKKNLGSGKLDCCDLNKQSKNK